MTAHNIFETISSQYFQLTNSEKKVADYAVIHQQKTQFMSISELAEECGVAELKMSDYGIKPEDFEKLAHNAMDTMGFLFRCDRELLSIEDCVAIYAASYK